MNLSRKGSLISFKEHSMTGLSRLTNNLNILKKSRQNALISSKRQKKKEKEKRR